MQELNTSIFKKIVKKIHHDERHAAVPCEMNEEKIAAVVSHVKEIILKQHEALMPGSNA